MCLFIDNDNRAENKVYVNAVKLYSGYIHSTVVDTSALVQLDILKDFKILFQKYCSMNPSAQITLEYVLSSLENNGNNFKGWFGTKACFIRELFK